MLLPVSWDTRQGLLKEAALQNHFSLTLKLYSVSQNNYLYILNKYKKKQLNTRALQSTYPARTLRNLQICFFCVWGNKQWQIQGGKGGASVPPFGLHLTLRSTDDELNGTPPFWLQKYENSYYGSPQNAKQINWTGRAGSLSQKRSKWAWFSPKVGVASKISRALCAQECTTTPLLEILDPPLTNIEQKCCLVVSRAYRLHA